MKIENFPVKLLNPNGPQNSTIFVLGKTGCGKTTLIANLLLREQRFVVIDVKDDYTADFFPFPVVTTGSLDMFRGELNKGTKHIIYRVSESGDMEQQVNGVLNLLYAFQRANATKIPPLTIALDEFNRFCDNQDCELPLENIIQRGRSLNVRKIFGAQWFNSVPTWARETFTELYVFRHLDPNGLNMLESFGLEAFEVSELPAYHCIHAGKNGIVHLALLPSGKGQSQTKQH